MIDQGLTDDQVAASTGVDRATINRLRRGKHRPSWALIDKLKDISGGQVGAEDFDAPSAPEPAQVESAA